MKLRVYRIEVSMAGRGPESVEFRIWANSYYRMNTRANRPRQGHKLAQVHRQLEAWSGMDSGNAPAKPDPAEQIPGW